MLEWVYRGLSKGRITTRFPAIAEPGAVLTAYMREGAEPLPRQSRWLRRSIHVRHIDCGSDGSEEWEIQALWNPHYDIQRLGFFLTNSPRHADVLVATGEVTAPMRMPLLRTWEVMPEPKALVAVGTDACEAIDRVLPVDVYVPGSPPTPFTIMHGLLLAAGIKVPELTA